MVCTHVSKFKFGRQGEGRVDDVHLLLYSNGYLSKVSNVLGWLMDWRKDHGTEREEERHDMCYRISISRSISVSRGGRRKRIVSKHGVCMVCVWYVWNLWCMQVRRGRRYDDVARQRGTEGRRGCGVVEGKWK